MKKILILTLPVPGHMNPGARIAEQLVQLGHEVYFSSLRDAIPFINRTGSRLNVLPFGEASFPDGALVSRHSGSTKKGGVAAFFGSVQFMRKFNDEVMTDLLAKAQMIGFDLLVADELVSVADAFAMALGIPFCSFAAALSVFPDRTGICPPPSSKRFPKKDLGSRLSNLASAKALDFWVGATHVSRRRRKIEDSFSKRLHLSLCPPSFDFPRNGLPSQYVYARPPHSMVRIPSHSGSRPILYAALGTLIHRQERLRVLKLISHLGAEMGFEVHIGMGAWTGPVNAREGFHPSAHLYEMAPQLELIQKADWVITHGGMNTVMESLSFGKPMVVLPYNQDQFGIAARVAFHGLGHRLDFKSVTEESLRSLLKKAVQNSSARVRAEKFQNDFVSMKTPGEMIHDRFLA